MRRAYLWILGGLIIVGAVSAAIAMATVRWLSPDTLKSIPASRPVPRIETVTPKPDSPEFMATEVIRRAGAGDVSGAAELSDPELLPTLQDQVAAFLAKPLRAVKLPGPEDRPEVLVWVEHRVGTVPALGTYEVAIAEGKVVRIAGPMAPSKGYQKFTLQPYDEKGSPIPAGSYQGQNLLIVAPRRPEENLALTLARLSETYAPKGITVVLALDLRSPDWSASARSAGFTGPVWRLKARLEDLPVVTNGQVLGASGLLINQDGFILGSLAALDPQRYGLTDLTVTDVANDVFRAYGLLR